MDSGIYVEIAYRGACYAVNTLRNGLHYSDDAERLVLNLEMERFRLLIWGENSGLTPAGGGQPSLPGRLLSISDVLSRYLDGISSLLQDADVLRDRYGLAETDAQPTSSARVKALLQRMQRTIPSSGFDSGGGKVRLDRAIGELDLGKTKAPSPSSASRLFRWAVRDLAKFNGLVVDLAGRITKLSQLLTESQQLKAQEDNERVNIMLVDGAADQSTLDFLMAAVKTAPPASSTRFRVESKAISSDLAWASPDVPYTSSLQPTCSLSQFILLEAHTDMKRFVTMKREADPKAVYLFERKDFDRNISHADKAKLMARIQRLVLLLSKPKTPAFRTPAAEGCISDPSRSCWWMVFRLPVLPSPVVTAPQLSSPEPVSLLSLLQPKARFRPPLEERYALASRLCTTLIELYSSSWLHKGIRSDNVLFAVQPTPPTPAQTSTILQSMVLCGFDYSRQETEQSTIDRSRSSGDVSTALYRHPCYQGEAAEGYKIQYDIYSLGLVLVEIALWMPLSSFLEGKPVGGAQKSGTSSARDSVKLSPDMTVFHEPHAAALKKRVMNRVESEFRFRVGQFYYEATKFCLEFADRKVPINKDAYSFVAHPSLAFYNAVVIPLSRLVKAHSEPDTTQS
ncbi:hypothetical protein CDD83_8006 [Cordyceps sp. RAO-2017]|nr:hypothetical protein CDD83_8006 [Cordyceps sp. RAO-2017]